MKAMNQNNKNHMKTLKHLSALFILLVLGMSQVPNKAIPAAQYYEGGQEAMYTFINSHVVYPVQAKRQRVQGECIIGLTINEDGTTDIFHVVKNIGGGCGEEALRVVKLLKFKAPGYKLKTSIPVIFKL
jgi:protein TonB